MGLLNLKRAKHAAVSKAIGVPTAVDFGSTALKVLQLSADEPPAIIAAGCVETPENLLADIKHRLEFQIEALPALVSSLPLRGRRAVCAIPTPLTFCKHAQFPRQTGMPADVLADNMFSEQLGRDATTLVRRLIEVRGADPTSGKDEYICLATGREIVERLMKAIKAAKLDVVGMHSEFESALSAFRRGLKADDGKDTATLYIDLGGGQTRVFIAHGDTLTFARSIAVGGLTLDERLAREMNAPIAEARKARMVMDDLNQRPAQEGGVAVAQAGACLREPLEILADETSMSVRYHDAMFPGTRVSSVVFFGGEARHRGLCQHLARALRLPAKVADPLSKIARTGAEKAVGVDLSKPQPGWAVAVGLCQRPTDL